jgi:putative intracellular protease/amidase
MACYPHDEDPLSKGTPMKRILMVLSSHAQLGTTGLSTGWYVPEAAHPWKQFVAAGFAVEFASPLGGTNPFDGFDPADPVQQEFLAAFGTSGPSTLAAWSIEASRYDAVFYVGGHGTMWDFADNAALASAGANIFESGGVVAAVCHGPAGLVNINLSDGSPLVAGKRLAAFTDAEEAAVGLTDVVPYLLASTLVSRGAHHEAAPNFEAKVVVDGRLVTGQNPASADGVAREVVALLA